VELMNAVMAITAQGRKVLRRVSTLLRAEDHMMHAQAIAVTTRAAAPLITPENVELQSAVSVVR
jgi:hypothetical protein